MESDLRAVLTADATLTALVGTRVYWNAYPQTAADPAVRLSKISGAPGYHMGGSDGLDASIVQIDVRAVSVTSMWAVRNAIVDRLSGFRGTQGSTVFQGIFLRFERQTAEKPGEQLYHIAQLDFDVWSGAAA